MKKHVIYDLDGVLLSSLHRYRTDKTDTKIDLQHWRANSTPEQIALDSPTALKSQYQKHLAEPGTLVCIATARLLCAVTIATIIEKLGGLPDLIHGRIKESDTQSGANFKIQGAGMLAQISECESLEFYDDNAQYCAAFQKAFPHAKITHVKSKQGH